MIHSYVNIWIGTLTTELGLLKEDNAYLRSKLAVEETVHESLLTRVQQPSLCVVCHSSEAIYPLPSQQRESERESLLRKLTAEREECMRLLAGLRDTLQCVRDREKEAIAQVKQSVETTTTALEEKEQVLLHVIELEREIENVNKRQESLLCSAREQQEVELEGVRRETQYKYNELETKLSQTNSDLKLKESELVSQTQSRHVLERKLKSAQSDMFENESRNMRTVHELRSKIGVLEAEKVDQSGVVESMRHEQESSDAIRVQELARARQEVEQQRSYLAISREESSKLRELTLEVETERNKFKNQVRTLKYEIESINSNIHSQVAKLQENNNLKNRKLLEEVHRLTDCNEILKIELEEFREKESQVLSSNKDEIKRVQNGFGKQISSLTTDLCATKKSLLQLDIACKQRGVENTELKNRSLEDRKLIDKLGIELNTLKEKRKEDTSKLKHLMTRHNSLLRERLQLCEMLEQAYQKPGKEKDNF